MCAYFECCVLPRLRLRYKWSSIAAASWAHAWKRITIISYPNLGPQGGRGGGQRGGLAEVEGLRLGGPRAGWCALVSQPCRALPCARVSAHQEAVLGALLHQACCREERATLLTDVFTAPGMPGIATPSMQGRVHTFSAPGVQGLQPQVCRVLQLQVCRVHTFSAPGVQGLQPQVCRVYSPAPGAGAGVQGLPPEPSEYRPINWSALNDPHLCSP